MYFGLLTWIFVLGIFTYASGDKANEDTAPYDQVREYEHYRVCPFPKCTRCPTIEELRAPGIGFALETSYGAAVIRHHNGSYQQAALIEGDASYTDLMRRLSAGPMFREPTHFDNNWEKWEYLKKRSERLLNKLLGRPANPETKILASMVSSLFRETQELLGEEHRIVAAVVSSPERIRLSYEETDDILDYLKLRNLMSEPDVIDDLWATSAAYAGYGRGLCTTYTDAYACEQEEWKFPLQRLLHIDFNEESLGGTIKSLESIKDRSVDRAIIDSDLGYMRKKGRPLDLAAEGDDDEAVLYWNAVSHRIRELVTSFKPRITEFMLTGTEATNPHFLTAMKQALHDLVGDESILSILDDCRTGSLDEHEWKALFQFATARGAAEVGKRRQEGPVRCTQTDECRKRREHTRQSMLLKQDPSAA